MGKRIFTFMIVCFGMVSSMCAQYNYFDAADIDADGWIWFDTQAKIDKYIGLANNDDYMVDPAGKKIQLVSANFDPFVDTEASDTIKGAGTDGIMGGVSAKMGGIKIAPASATSGTNGGSFVVCLPSCTSFNLFLSSGSTMYAKLTGSTNVSQNFNNYTVVSAKYTTVFSKLSSAGQKKWEGMETLNSGFEPIFTLASSNPVYARLQNFTKYPLLVQGMKILTSTPTGINSVKEDSPFGIRFDGKILTLKSEAQVSIYTLAGSLVLRDFSSSVNLGNLNKGVYIVKANSNSLQETTKISVQ